jgi:omega-6 fatty acid desaturase (delta-12 desaturase)
MNPDKIVEELDNNTRLGRDLHTATLPYANEIVARSWFATISTLMIIALSLLLAVVSPWWPIRIAASVFGGMCMVRGFAIFHDYMHGSILRHSWLAKVIFNVYGALMLTPPSVWRKNHNYHHAHVGKTSESYYGSVMTRTTDDWNEMSLLDRLIYRIIRNPLTIVFGYITVLLYCFCLEPLIVNLRKHWDSAVVIGLHVALLFTMYSFLGLAATIYGYLLPLWVASAVGAYLFYVQHNWEGMQYLPEDDWNYFDAAVHSSSFLKLGPVMRWFTANIGYHHIHHLNSKIPFYRLPEAMAGIPELQNPSTITIHPRDIIASLRLKLWDVHEKRMVGFK